MRISAKLLGPRSEGGIVTTIFQFIAGAALLCFSIWLKFHHFEVIVEHSPKLKTWTRGLAQIALGLLAAACFIDPLIPGVANLTIEFPTVHSNYPTLFEHLRVRVAPVGLSGSAGGDRTIDAPFDRDGSVQVLPNLAWLETSVTIQVYDETQPSQVIKSANVYISPFVRRQLVSKTITF